MIPNKSSIRLTMLTTVFVGCVVSFSASGFDLSFLKGSPIAAFSEEDRNILVNAFRQAMASNEDGEISEWNNPDTGNRGSIKVLKTTTRDDRPCRKARFENQAGKNIGRSEFFFCQAADGSWQVSQ